MATTTARSMIQDTLELMGVYDPGDQITAADAERSLSTLNDMLEVWSNEPLACFTWKQNNFTLIVNQSDYTIGPGGDIDSTRPMRVSNDPGSAFLTDQYGNKYPMDVLDQMAWNLRTSSAVNSNLPDTLNYVPETPLGIIRIWPIPSESYLCSFSSYQQLAGFTTLDTSESLPPGYRRAIVTNLALSLKPYFTSAKIDDLVVKEALETKGSIKRNNIRSKRSLYDPEIIARGSSTYNIKRDSNY
jgi:hypothetical protein